MKYALSVRNSQLRKKADELIIAYKDKEIIYELLKTYPNMKYVLKIMKTDEPTIDWKELYQLDELINLTIGLENILIRPQGLKYYWLYPISTYYELQGVINLGVSEIILAAPLSFDLPQVRKRFSGIIRMVPNYCLSSIETSLFPTGLYGTFIRPEDVDIYGKYVDVLEFVYSNAKHETALYEIYHDKKEWKGNLNLLLTNLNIDIDNRGIPEEFGLSRVQCQQKCMRTQNCHLCEHMFDFTTAIDTHKKEIREMLS